MKNIYLAFCSVIPWGLEPYQRNRNPSFYPLNYGTKCVAKIIKKRKGEPCPPLFFRIN